MSRQHSSQDRQTHPMERANILGAALLLLLAQIPETAAVASNKHKLLKLDSVSYNQAVTGAKRPFTISNHAIPLIITNNCPDVLWPGIATQAGEAPETNGFQLGPGQSRNLTVGPTWNGRVWGRTNCTVGGDTATCVTGDCNGKLNCVYGGAAPATLAEFNLAGGVAGQQTFYDISLVDGYNLPMGIVYHPAANTSFIPPNLVNPMCIATAGFLSAPSQTGLAYTNATYPMPYQATLTNQDLATWCPWDLQVFTQQAPADGVYEYPDGGVGRPVFDPCMSACAHTQSPQDCCTGDFDDPHVCGPSTYSKYAKTVCPDAYSYAFDDQTSTFIIPKGGGWEVVFCPAGRSTNIMARFSKEVGGLASGTIVNRRKVMEAGRAYFDRPKVSGASGGAKRVWGDFGWVGRLGVVCGVGMILGLRV